MLYFQCRCWLSGGTIGKMEPQFLYHEIPEITRVPCTIWTSNLSIIQPVSHLMMPRCGRRSMLPVLGSCSATPLLDVELREVCYQSIHQNALAAGAAETTACLAEHRDRHVCRHERILRRAFWKNNCLGTRMHRH